MSCDQNAGQNQNTQVGGSFFESVGMFRYLGTLVTHQNCLYKEVKNMLYLGNTYYHLI
jgi:hypothetical protein